MPSAADIRQDLIAEQQSLDEMVSALSPAEWRRPTPSPGWSVADQIGHLAYFDRTAADAIRHPDAFRATAADLFETVGAAEGALSLDDLTLGPYRQMDPDGLLGAWRAARSELAEASIGLGDDTRIPWYGPDMGARSFLSARVMECWAHGQDVADALDLERTPTDRLQHVARLGVNTRAWSYLNRGLPPPAEPVRVVLEAPSGSLWTYGPDDAVESVTGPALDFCLVVVQRRHLDETDLRTTPLGREWMEKAQAFAGPPTEGPPPGRRDDE